MQMPSLTLSLTGGQAVAHKLMFPSVVLPGPALNAGPPKWQPPGSLQSLHGSGCPCCAMMPCHNTFVDQAPGRLCNSRACLPCFHDTHCMVLLHMPVWGQSHRAAYRLQCFDGQCVTIPGSTVPILVSCSIHVVVFVVTSSAAQRLPDQAWTLLLNVRRPQAARCSCS